MQGINVQQGIIYCGGLIEDYIDVVSAYYKTGLHKIQEIEDSYQKKDWKNYTILVHAVKSTSLGIGAEELSEMAKALQKKQKILPEIPVRQRLKIHQKDMHQKNVEQRKRSEKTD